VSTVLLVMGLLVLTLLGVGVVTHYQTAIAVREASPCAVPSAAALNVGGDFSRITLSPDIVAMVNDSEMVP
jgi:hypothetical protein